jgi:hypothetical protein
MIALKAIQPEPQPRHVEQGRNATRRRFRRAARRPYIAFARLGAIIVLPVLPVMIYLMLTANITSLNYKLSHLLVQKAALQAETLRQEDQIAKLESRERLAAVAARLHMHDPQIWAVVTPPAPPRAPASQHEIPLLGAMNQWLDAAGTESAHE